MQRFRTFNPAERTPEGIESMHMMRKGQVKWLGGRDSAGQARSWLNLINSGSFTRQRSSRSAATVRVPRCK